MVGLIGMVGLKRPEGFAAFLLVWAGQALSLIGTVMTGFALTIWAYQLTGQATALALVGFFTFAPSVVFIPFAGVIVDRSNRKLMMMISDVAALLSAVAILLLYNAGGLQIWHLCVAGFFTGLFSAFQWPAYSAAISLMLPKAQYARAGSFMAVAEYGSNIAAPILAVALLARIGIAGIMVLDILSFGFAIVALLLVRIPQPAPDPTVPQRNILREVTFGFQYIRARPSLFGLQSVYFVGNFASQVALTLTPAMILARTDNNNDVLASVQTAFGVGGVAGAVLISVTGGLKARRAIGVLAGWLLYSIGIILFGLGAGQVWWIVTSFGSMLFVVLLDSSNQALWQSKIPPTMQGRVFSARALIARLAVPLAALAAGPLADYVFEPAFIEQGKGAGMSALIALAGCIGVAAALVGFNVRRIRDADQIIPDYDAVLIPETDPESETVRPSPA